jgi:hypothetical protein
MDAHEPRPPAPPSSRAALVLPWILMIGGDAVAGWRGYLAASWYQQWQHDRVFDPSAAELTLLNAQTETGIAVGALAVGAAGVVLFVLAQRRRSRQAAAQGTEN